MVDLDTDVRYIKGIGEKRAKALAKLGIRRLGGLVSYFPRAYEDRSNFAAIGDVRPDETVSVRATLASPPKVSHIRAGLDLCRLRAVDDTGSMEITFFNQSYVTNSLKVGESFVFYGKIGGMTGRPTMTNPIFEPESAAGRISGRIIPVYRLTSGISQNFLINAVSDGLMACDELFPSPLPEYIREKYKLAQSRFAYNNIHFPENYEALELARRRLIFEELFVLSAALRLMRESRIVKTGISMNVADMDAFYRVLPFSLTAAQRRVIEEAVRDMRGGEPMSRLIQGDVGSGKTATAAACAYFVFNSGYQSAFMAPTEILAAQHYKTLSELLSPLGMRVGLLTGKLTAKAKREINALISQGYYNLVVGTHALLSEGVSFQNLALVITDEQHRFGVNQRSALVEKGPNPHVLVMSATPIPRTLALIIYGDLDVSVIDELPPGRQSVDTFAVGEDMRERIMRFTRKLINQGRQAYFICPMIEDTENLSSDLKAAREYAEELQSKIFPDLKVDFIHGRMKPKEKEAVMGDFASGKTHILVATTVVEVGVDVPNAALMVIENAERFGLSQLHQLRGRVGRGAHKSYCVLFSGSSSPDTRARLKVMCETGDGFKIAEEDLRLRGPGDFFGSRQHGLPEMKIADLSYDMNILHSAGRAADAALGGDPKLEKEEHSSLRGRIMELFELNADTFN